MGLTGHILEVEVQLERVPSAWILQESERLPDAERLIDGLREASREWPFTVCWADGLAGGSRRGRGLLIRGRWARPGEAPHHLPGTRPRLSVPFNAPNALLGQWNVGWFNAFYFHKHGRRMHRRVVHPEVFFHPLDVLRGWNRLYGRRGFTQYQCVLPELDGEVCRKLLEIPASHGAGSFLTVIKDCGAEGRGMLSFPMRGVSIALDLPLIPGRTQAAVDALNESVLARGGRIYLAKDALTRPEHFRGMEGRLDAWNSVRRRWDPSCRLVSAQSVRLLGDPP
jgi:FAD/FMN-containing dehydrogenase